MSKQITITLPWSHMAAVIASGAVGDVRYFINGFAVIADPKTHKLCLCGTDGHRLTLARTKAAVIPPWPKNGLIFDYPEIKPKGKDARGEVTITVDLDDPKGSSLWWPGRSAPLPLVPIDGTYPDIWRVLPDGKTEATEQITFNPSLITPIQRALGSGGCQFTLRGENNAILIDWKGASEVQTVLMPMRW
jgi:hypothetical protein